MQEAEMLPLTSCWTITTCHRVWRLRMPTTQTFGWRMLTSRHWWCGTHAAGASQLILNLARMPLSRRAGLALVPDALPLIDTLEGGYIQQCWYTTNPRCCQASSQAEVRYEGRQQVRQEAECGSLRRPHPSLPVVPLHDRKQVTNLLQRGLRRRMTVARRLLEQLYGRSGDIGKRGWGRSSCEACA